MLFFAIACVIIYNQLSAHTWVEIKSALLTIPTKNFIYAGMACLLGYIALTFYDFLALKYINEKLSCWKWMLTSFIGFSVSNNAGHAVVSGGTIRYRFYSRWGLEAIEIVKMVIFSGFTYLVGCFFALSVGYVVLLSDATIDLSGFKVISVVSILSFAGLILYFLLSIFIRKTIRIKNITFKMPSFKMSLTQVFVGTMDTVFASLILYFAMIPFVSIPFYVFIGVFVVAQVLGVFSQVPGGLGVFESIFLLILPDYINDAHIFASLIAYRIIYYFIPLLVSGMLLSSYEIFLKLKKNKINESK